MRRDPSYFMQVQNQFLQQHNQPGVFKGEVVDVRDPTRQGRVRVQVYALDGDYPRTDIATLKWVDPIQPGRSFHPPQLGDRVAITFEAGDKTRPIMLGYIYESPMYKVTKQGRLPWNTRTGSDVPPQGWHHHDGYPESIVLGRSGNGNSAWMQDIFMSPSKDSHQGTLVSSVCLEDTGGKTFRTLSVHRGVNHWSPVTQLPVGKGGLYKKAPLFNSYVRTGLEVGGGSQGSTTVGDSVAYTKTHTGSGATVQMVAGGNTATVTGGAFSVGTLSVGSVVAAQGALIAGTMYSPPKSW